MKLFLILSLAFAAGVKKEKGLPYEPDTTKVAISQLPAGPTLNLNFHLGLPKTQQLNKGAPSFVGIYEKEKGASEWTETARIPLSEFVMFGDTLDFNRPIALRSPTSDIAIHSTVYHCGKEKKTMCYIQGYQAIASRTTKQASNTVPFYIEGQMK